MPYGDNFYSVMIDDVGDIFEISGYQKGRKIGIDTKREKDFIDTQAEMQSVIDNYYSKLVELGAIEVPKTPEELIQEQNAQQAEINQKLCEQVAQQAEINQKLVESIADIQTELKGLKNRPVATNTTAKSISKGAGA